MIQKVWVSHKVSKKKGAVHEILSVYMLCMTKLPQIQFLRAVHISWKDHTAFSRAACTIKHITLTWVFSHLTVLQ